MLVPRRCALLLAIAALLLTGCLPFSGADPSVGTLLHGWSQAQTDERAGVEEIAPGYRQPHLITTRPQWDAFVQQLPAGLRTHTARRALADLDLDNSVVVVATYGKCTEVSSMVDHGDGALDFRVDGDPDTACAWSPLQLEVWQVTLAEIDVDDPATVRLVDGGS